MKKALLTVAATALLLTQTGCIVGIATGTAWLPFASLMLFVEAMHFESGSDANSILMLTGMVLDEKNPGRVEALNVLPVDEQVAQNLHTNVEAIQIYNEELPQVHQANAIAEKAISAYSKGLDVAKLDRTSQDLGFSGKEELLQVLKKDKLDQEALNKFAQAQHLSPETARLYLKLRFNVRDI